ncbi:hypothetical protein CYMTET_42456 [Cymbomonas tetramitiformis]|uniref:Uncharacterized protein n=1 Tax=Cymbomonas tetramitiformis TaxID=36881 RepID=A0AAE0C679_9CHLO|nr:hypothetical protein CYMTET_42456 [Cymbomonas tetramitiformis]
MDAEMVKRVVKDALGAEDADFLGNEENQNVLWTSLVKSVLRAFKQKDPPPTTLSLIWSRRHQGGQAVAFNISGQGPLGKDTMSSLPLDTDITKVDLEDIVARGIEPVGVIGMAYSWVP